MSRLLLSKKFLGVVSLYTAGSVGRYMYYKDKPHKKIEINITEVKDANIFNIMSLNLGLFSMYHYQVFLPGELYPYTLYRSRVVGTVFQPTDIVVKCYYSKGGVTDVKDGSGMSEDFRSWKKFFWGISNTQPDEQSKE